MTDKTMNKAMMDRVEKIKKEPCKVKIYKMIKRLEKFARDTNRKDSIVSEKTTS